MLSINVGSRKIVKSLYTNKILHNLLLPEKRIEVKYHNLHKTNVIKSLDYKQNIAPTNTKKSYPGIICRSNYSNDKNAIFNNSKQNYLDKNAFYNKNEQQTQEKQSQYASVRPPLDQPSNYLTKISHYCTSCHKDNDKESTKKKDHGRYKYEAEVESAINEQILTELNASYTYLSMACYFGNTNIALPGSEGLYMKMHEEEHQHAHKLINYQNLRGGTVVLCSIAPPEVKDWESIGKSLEVALEMEKTVKKVTLKVLLSIYICLFEMFLF